MFQTSKKVFVRRVTCALLLVLAALAVNYSSTLSWGGAEAADGTRYKVSPNGILHVLEPGTTISPTVLSQWSPEAGDALLRAVAPGGERAYTRLKLTYPLLQTGFWLALAGAAAVLLPFWQRQRRMLFTILASGAAGAILAAVVLFITSTAGALAVLTESKDFGYGGTLGCMLVGIAPVLIAGASAQFLPRLRWLPFLVLLIFNLAVWYQNLLFLVPIAAVLFLTANFLAVSRTDDMNRLATAG
jgi:hypothetical protein